MATFISSSPEETESLGQSWGITARHGQVIGLSGDLGTGKTQLVKGLARGLGVKAQVHSPSFALVHEYTDGRLPLFHIDLYRLQSPSQVIGAGLEEYFYNPPGVTVIEWVERWGAPPDAMRYQQSPPDDAPLAYREVNIETLSETERLIHYEDFGP